MARPPVLLYDGECALCAWAVRFLIARDPGGTLRFASLQGRFARGLLAARPALAALDTVVWYEPPAGGRPARVLTRSAAVLQALASLGWPWRLVLLARLVPSPLRDAVYRLVSRTRRRVFGRPRACVLPPPGQAHRFLE